MTGADDIGRIQKTKRFCIVRVSDESNSILAASSRSAVISGVLAEPANPKEMHELGRPKGALRLHVADIDVEDPNDSSVPEGVVVYAKWIISRTHHNITVVCARIHRVLTAANIVCSEIDSQDLVTVEPVIHEKHSVAVNIREIRLIAIVILAQQTAKKMVLQTRVKILCTPANEMGFRA
jgi:hypothetical protein